MDYGRIPVRATGAFYRRMTHPSQSQFGNDVLERKGVTYGTDWRLVTSCRIRKSCRGRKSCRDRSSLVAKSRVVAESRVVAKTSVA